MFFLEISCRCMQIAPLMCAWVQRIANLSKMTDKTVQ